MKCSTMAQRVCLFLGYASGALSLCVPAIQVLGGPMYGYECWLFSIEAQFIMAQHVLGLAWGRGGVARSFRSGHECPGIGMGECLFNSRLDRFVASITNASTGNRYWRVFCFRIRSLFMDAVG